MTHSAGFTSTPNTWLGRFVAITFFVPFMATLATIGVRYFHNDLFLQKVSLQQTSIAKKDGHVGRVAGAQTINVTACGCLNQANTDYVLQNDVVSDGSCFAIAGQNISLDLNGHTITYDNMAPIAVPNGDFEEGTGAAATNWDFSNAPSAQRIVGTKIGPVQVYSGSASMKFPTPAADQYIRSDAITLQPNTKYSLSAVAYNPYGGKVYVELEGTATQAYRTGILYRGYQYFYTTFTTGASPETYNLRLGVTDAGSLPSGQIYLDDVQIRKFRSYAVTLGANPGLSTTPADLACYSEANTSGGVIKNGTIIQGQASSNYGHGVSIAASNALVEDLNITVQGPNSININSDQEATALTIQDNYLVNNVTTITSRESFDGAAIYANRSNGTVIRRNTIRGGIQGGISLDDFRGNTVPLTVDSNDITVNSKYTNDFAITVWGDANTTISNNTIDCTQGTDGCRGIYTGGGASGTKILNNTVSVREVNRNQEYNGCEINGAYGIQIEYASNVEVGGNTITAVADECPGYAFRINPWNDAHTITGTNNSAHDNTFIGVSRNGTTQVSSANLITDIQDASVLSYLRNILIADQYWFYFSANTTNFPMASTTFAIGGSPTSPYTPLFSYNPAPPGPSTVDAQFIDNRYGNAAARTAFENTSFVCQGSLYACAVGGGSAIDKYASFFYSWYLTVTVKGNDNNPISNATVTAVDTLGTTRFTGTTDANGVVTATLPQWYNDASVLTQYNGYTITASANGKSNTASVTMDASKAQTITLDTSGTADVTAPTISSVGTDTPTQTGTTVSWTTNELANSQVEYGLTTGYGSTTTLSGTMVTSHSQELSGLAAGTLYHFRVKSSDAAGNPATSSDYTFTTAAAPDTTPPARVTNLSAT
jgi:hypothetical protein